MRLDNLLVEKQAFDSRTKANQSIKRGEIYVNNVQVLKASFDVDFSDEIDRRCESEYVSVGGFKLEKALKDFNFSVKDLIVADIGASTGGFTDCLLKYGANSVFAVDLRDDLLHKNLKNNNRVIQIVKNAKELSKNDFIKPLDLIVADLSFISLSQVMAVFASLIDDGKKLLILIKPQFETGEKRKYKNGIIKDKKIHKSVCLKVYNCAKTYGFAPQAITTAPLSKEKNTEFLFLLEKNGKILLPEDFTNNI